MVRINLFYPNMKTLIWIRLNYKGFLTFENYHEIVNGLFTQVDVVPCSKGLVSKSDVPLVNIGVREVIQ